MDKGKQKLATLLVSVFGIALLVFSGGFNSGKVISKASAQEEVVVDEKEAKEAENSIKKIEDEIKKEEKEKQASEQDLSQIQGAVYNTQKEINKTESLIGDAEETIGRKEKEINLLTKKSEEQKKILVRLIREMYYNSQNPIIYIILSQDNFSQNVSNVDHLLTIKKKIVGVVNEIKISKEKIEDDKEELEVEKEDHKQLLAMKEAQQQEMIIDKIQTQAKVDEKVSNISNLRSKLSKLRSELSKMLGQAYDAKDISDAAKFASNATGVRKDFLMGMLVVESSLGRYTGGCDYKESRMSDYRKELFKELCDDLDYNYKKMKVSCPPAGYNGTGGAMGVAQFMSDTWMGYKDSITAVTGHNPPDPWSLTDGVTAMALKVAKVSGVTAHNRSSEAKSYCVYLAGNNWTAYCGSSYKSDYSDFDCANSRNYGEKVLCWADNYEKLLD